MNKPQLVSTKDPLTGSDVKVAVYMSEEQVVELLNNLKRQKEEKTQMDEVQKAAGSVGN